MISTIGQNLAQAAFPLQNVESVPSPHILPYGKIADIPDFKTAKLVINIQDLHGNEEIQKNIVKIIELLQGSYKIEKIFVEGAYGNIDLNWLTNMIEVGKKVETLDKLLKEGQLNAAEYYAIKNSRLDILTGLEEEFLHKININRLGDIIEKQSLYQNIIQKISKQNIANLKNINKKYRAFNNIVNTYKSGKVNEKDFYYSLHKRIDEINSLSYNSKGISPLNFCDYPNIEKTLDLAEIYNDINLKEMNVDLQNLTSSLQKNLAYKDYDFFRSLINKFDAVALLRFLECVSQKLNTNIAKTYPYLHLFLEAKKLEQEINYADIIVEEKRLVEKLEIAYCKNEIEMEFAFLINFEKYLAAFLQNQLLFSDFQYFLRNFEKFKKLYTKHSLINYMSIIEADFDFLKSYYEVNNTRSEVFADKIIKYFECDDLDKKGVVVAISGGYHSAELKRLLSNRGISTITVTPDISELNEKEKLYEKTISRQTRLLKKERENIAYKNDKLAPILPSQVQGLRHNLITSILTKEIDGKAYNKEEIKNLFGRTKMLPEVICYYVNDKNAGLIFENGTNFNIKNNAGKINVISLDVKVKNKRAEWKNISTYLFGEHDITKEYFKKLLKIFDTENIWKTDTLYLLKQLYIFAYNNNIYELLNRNGLILELAEYMQKHPLSKDEIDGINTEVVANMPKYLQKMIYEEIKCEELHGTNKQTLKKAEFQNKNVLDCSASFFAVLGYFLVFLSFLGLASWISSAGMLLIFIKCLLNSINDISSNRKTASIFSLTKTLLTFISLFATLIMPAVHIVIFKIIKTFVSLFAALAVDLKQTYKNRKILILATIFWFTFSVLSPLATSTARLAISLTGKTFSKACSNVSNTADVCIYFFETSFASIKLYYKISLNSLKFVNKQNSKSNANVNKAKDSKFSAEQAIATKFALILINPNIKTNATKFPISVNESVMVRKEIVTIASFANIEPPFLQTLDIIARIKFGTGAKNKKTNLSTRAIDEKSINQKYCKPKNIGAKPENAKYSWIRNFDKTVAAHTSDKTKSQVAMQNFRKKVPKNFIASLPSQESAKKHNDISASLTNIFENQKKEKVDYSLQENVNSSLTAFDWQISQGNIKNFKTLERKIKETTKFMKRQFILHNIDNIKKPQDIMNYIEQLNRLGNWQILISTNQYNSIKTMLGSKGKMQFKKFLNKINNNGTEMYLSIFDKNELNKYKQEGFNGFVYVNNEKKLKIYIESLQMQFDVNTLSFKNLSELHKQLITIQEISLINNTKIMDLIEAEHYAIAIEDVIEFIKGCKNFAFALENKHINADLSI
ncbi:MAG: hypothetical protein LBU55_05495 [Elusimicrobiota bacterium]|nr:hypothetical protein [Elusimicrobiota bacterium]